MRTQLVTVTLALTALLLPGTFTLTAQQPPALYNTVKQKLQDGRQVVGGTVMIDKAEFQAGDEVSFLRAGARASLGAGSAAAAGGRGVAPLEGSEAR